MIVLLQSKSSPVISWGGNYYNVQYLMATPLIGYLGGTDIVKNKVLTSGIKILLIYYLQRS